MSDLPFWAFPAIAFAGLLGTGGIVALMANAKRNTRAKAPIPPGGRADLFEGTVVGELTLNQSSGVFVRLSPTDVDTLRSKRDSAAAHGALSIPATPQQNET